MSKHFVFKIWILVVSFGMALGARAQAPAMNSVRLADPAVLFYKGVYYLYGTNGGNAEIGFPVFTSIDQKSWISQGMALKKGDAFGTTGFWAPQVFPYKGKFYMAYTANENIAIAVADHPLGPFRQWTQEAIKAPVRMIDPFIFFDKGKVYLYHVRLQEGNRIFVAEMSSDLKAIRENTLKPCIQATAPWEDTEQVPWKVVEGPTVLRQGKQYFLIYSANDFRNVDYAIGYATSRSPLGPWKKFEGNPIISKKDIQVNGPGHGDLYRDAAGHWQYVFHTHFDDTRVAPRRTALMPLSIQKDKKGKLKISTHPEKFHFIKSKP